MPIDEKLLILAKMVGDGRKWGTWDAVDREISEKSGYARYMVYTGRTDIILKKLTYGKGTRGKDGKKTPDTFRGVSGKIRVAPVFDEPSSAKVERRTGWEGKVKLEPKAPGRRRWRGDE